MNWTADKALDHWVEQKLLTTKKADELRDALPKEDVVPSRAIAIFSALGGILVGLGIILFVASNWQYLSPLAKVIILMVAMLSTGGVGYYLTYEKKQYEKTGLALLFINAMIYGASIFLVAQIYHLPLNYWWGMLLWFLGTSFFAYVLQSKLHLWVSVPIFLFFIGWLRSTMATGFGEFSFLFDEKSMILTITPLIGASLVALAVLHRDRLRASFGEFTLFHWGLFLIVLTFVISTIDKELFYPIFRLTLDPVTIIIAASTALLLGLAFFFGQFKTAQGKWSMLALGIYLIGTYKLAWLPTWIGVPEAAMGYESIPMVTGLFVLHTLLTFIFLLVITWYGTVLRMAGVINLGIAGLGIAVFIQYFSWAFELLDRSIAFIVGGLLILALGATLENRRRKLLSSIR